MDHAGSEKQLTGTVLNIMRFSVNDGPGIRTTVFFKGCPLRCAWCHNPESISRDEELILRDDRCTLCGDCAEACVRGAIKRTNGGFTTARDMCTACGECVHNCFADARTIAGQEMTPDEVMDEVLKDRVFFDESKGGVTFSGGEPLLQHEFLLALLRLCKSHGIHTAVDTTGFAAKEVIAKVSPLVDLFLYDLKIADDVDHQRYTGASNRVIIENMRAIVTAGKDIVVRVPVIPGINADSQNVQELGELLASMKTIGTVQLLPYHASGADKYARIGKSYELADIRPPDPEQLDLIAQQLKQYIPRVIIGGGSP